MNDKLKQRFEVILKEKVDQEYNNSKELFLDIMYQAYAEAEQDKWVSAEMELPKNQHWYRVLRNSKHHILPHNYDEKEGKWYEYGSAWPTDYNITHWQPFEDLSTKIKT